MFFQKKEVYMCDTHFSDKVITAIVIAGHKSLDLIPDRNRLHFDTCLICQAKLVSEVVVRTFDPSLADDQLASPDWEVSF